MNIYSVAFVVCSLIGILFSLGFWLRCCLKDSTMENYRFNLYRRLIVGDQVVISAFTIDRITHNPFIERMVIARENPGFAVGADFVSDTGREYESTFGKWALDSLRELSQEDTDQEDES